MPSDADLTISPKTGCAYLLFLVGFAVAGYFIGKRDGRDEEITRQQLAALHAFDPNTARPDPITP